MHDFGMYCQIVNFAISDMMKTNLMSRYSSVSAKIIVILLVITSSTCRENEERPPSPHHIVIHNNDIQERQDVSSFFSAQTIVVDRAQNNSIPGKVRHFEFFENTLYLVRHYPVGQIIAIDEEGYVKWQLKANADPVTSFSKLSSFELDRARKLISIYDEQKNRIYRYDLNGKYTASEELPSLYFDDVATLGEQATFFSISSRKNEFESDSTKLALIAYENAEVANSTAVPLLSQDHYYSDRVYFTDFSDFFTGSNGSLYYHRNFDDTLFLLESQLRASPILTISFSQNDRREEVVSDPNANIVLDALNDNNVPNTQFAVIVADYFLAGYTYDNLETFTLVDLENSETLINTQIFRCEGKDFAGRLDYRNGILLNQMYVEDYRVLRSTLGDLGQDDDGLTELLATQDGEDIVYTILTPNWK